MLRMCRPSWKIAQSCPVIMTVKICREYSVPRPIVWRRPRATLPLLLLVRVRTIGDIISTGCVESPASTVADIIAEIAAARVTERGSRADDKASEAAMEDRKKAGYF